jgi:UDP-N-acetylmuramoyl-tripeptide--D-alanyl-D-alanine ligase
MLELGEASHELHAGLADALDPEQVQCVYLYGPEMRALYERLADKYDAEHLFYFDQDSQSHLSSQLLDGVYSDDLILLKGSHGMHLEKVLQALLDGSRE